MLRTDKVEDVIVKCHARLCVNYGQADSTPLTECYGSGLEVFEQLDPKTERDMMDLDRKVPRSLDCSVAQIFAKSTTRTILLVV